MIIGIMGKAGAGKDTAAGELVKIGFLHVSLATPMKEFCKKIFGFTDEQLYGPSRNRNVVDNRYLYNGGKHSFSNIFPFCCIRCGAMSNSDGLCGLTPRRALQTLGTEWGREMHADVWIGYLIRQAEGKNIVVSDCRFRNEFDAVKSSGGRVIRILRQDAGLTGPAAMHASEREQESIADHEFDAIVKNDGTIPELGVTLREIVRGWV